MDSDRAGASGDLYPLGGQRSELDRAALRQPPARDLQRHCARRRERQRSHCFPENRRRDDPRWSLCVSLASWKSILQFLRLRLAIRPLPWLSPRPRRTSPGSRRTMPRKTSPVSTRRRRRAVLATDEDRELHARRGARGPGSGRLRRQRSPHRQARGSNLAPEQQAPRQGRASARNHQRRDLATGQSASRTDQPPLDPAGGAEPYLPGASRVLDVFVLDDRPSRPAGGPCVRRSPTGDGSAPCHEDFETGRP